MPEAEATSQLAAPVVPRMQRFEGRRILVTGGSRGIAAAIARALAVEGALVAVNFSAMADEGAGKACAAAALVEEITAAGGHAVVAEQDLMVPAAGRSLADKALKALGGIDGLVLSASTQERVPFLDARTPDIDAQFRLNLHANIEILQGLLGPMAAQGFGRILTIGSIQEVSPSSEMPIYAMTKAALKNLVENLAVQAAPHGVTINNLSPGLIETDRNAGRRVDAAGWRHLVAHANPMGVAGQPDDLVGAALYLLSEDARFVTGATLYVTGGAQIPTPAGDRSLRSDLIPPTDRNRPVGRRDTG